MSTTIQSNRGYVKTATAKVEKEHNGSSNAIQVKLPQGSHLLGVAAAGVTAFDGSGTVTLTATDGTTTFISAENVKDAVGNETVDVTSKAFPSGGTISVYITDQNSDSTEGEVWVTFTYAEANGCNEVYG